VHEGAVGILIGIGEGVVLAVHGHPLTTVLPRGDPQDDAEEEIRDGVQREGAMRETSMQLH